MDEKESCLKLYARNRLTKIIINRLTKYFVRTVQIKIGEHKGCSCRDFIIIFKNSPFIVDFNMRTFIFLDLPKSLEIKNHYSTFVYGPICMNANITLSFLSFSLFSSLSPIPQRSSKTAFLQKSF